MKFLECTPLESINLFLSDLNLGESTIKGNLEAFSCKHTGMDRKLSISLEHEILDYLGQSAESDPSSPMEYLSSRSSRKTLIYLVLALNHIYPDYDFSAVQAHRFFREEELDIFKQIFDTYMFEAARAGRYRNSEEIPYFPDGLPLPLVPPYKFPMWLHPAAASVNVSNSIRDMYFNSLLPLFTPAGEDGNYASSAESDLVCLQALSRRIHYGRFVAEVKFRGAPEDYTCAIYNKDKSTLMKLVTSESQEAAVQKRVEKKAVVFGQDVTLETKVDVANKGTSQSMYKVDPLVVSRLYKEWVIPMTKIVEVDYLLRRLD